MEASGTPPSQDLPLQPNELSDGLVDASTLPQDAPPTTNGNHDPIIEDMGLNNDNLDTTTGTPIRTKGVAHVTLDSKPATLTPSQDGAPGITPLADFVPQDAANLSHPTPPPDEPLVDGSASVDVEMDDAELVSLPPDSILAPVSNEQSLVRPREDDADDQPAPKRSRMEGDLIAADEASLAALSGLPSESEQIQPAALTAGQSDVDAVVAAPAPDTAEALAPSTTESVQEEVDSSAPQAIDASLATSRPDSDLTTAPAPPPSTENGATMVQGSVAQERPQGQSEAAATAPEIPRYDTSPLTQLQRNFLVEKMKNLKKTKNSVAFLRPVDPIAMNIPTYPDLVKEPMDLGTMDTKLKEGRYTTVKDFTDDFELIISNVRRFNGDAHAVTQAGFSMQAYFNRMMESVPSANMPPPAVKKNRSPSLPKEEKPRREPRAVTQAVPAPTTSSASAGTYAVAPNGTPQIRRQSSMSDRPARAIKPPQNREIAYAKPKRKERQLELKFCDHILEELRSTRYGTLNHIFQTPVDPVALNIPNYFQVIKHPMDMSTMGQRLKAGEYGTADEFKKDFDLMIKNCLTFNPAGNPVRDLAIQFQREFEALWAGKHKWERKNQPASNRASSASADEDSGADDDDDDEDDSADKSATIRALQKQLADMQNALSGLGEKPSKSKKSKSSKATSKKASGSLPSAPPKSKPAYKPASKSKKPRQVTYEEKQEISDAVARMDDRQVTGLTDLIVQNCAKYRNMDDMELEIDDLPPHVQVMLLDYVRRIFGNPNRKAKREASSPDDAAALDDDDYEEKGRAARGSAGDARKGKKHRPMGKQEQQDAISSLQNKLAQFSQAGKSESPTGSSFNTAAKAEPDTSGDDASETSEEE